MARARLLRALLGVAVSLGRWWVEWLAEHGMVKLEGYMIGKIADFKRRRALRSGGALRRLNRRIDRWQRALRWLRRKRAELFMWLDRAYCRGWAELQRVPIVSAAEARCHDD